ncbi:sine oculis-binding protein homolog B isoform X2 [Pseudorasbora parva]
MNELLGWYGYDRVDLQDSDAADARSRAKRNHISVLKEISVPKPQASERKAVSSDAPLSPSSSSHSSSSSPRAMEQHMNVIVPLIKPSAVEDVQNVQIVCVWCQKEGMKRYSLLMGSELKSFCSEKCFAACRRAYFKRNKARDEDRHGDQSPPPGQTLDTPTRLLLKMNNNTRVCDWCKHVRHTKEYLDFGSGEERLQFCSTKCLNQYKMDVFYREARAALTGSKNEENRPKPAVPENQNLLTPEAWDSPAKTPQTLTPSSSLRTAHSKTCSTLEPRPHQMPLPFVRPPLHAQGLRSPAPNPPHPLSPAHRASFAPPPVMHPYGAPYVPFHPPQMPPPQMPPPWPHNIMLLPYPVFVPIPVPIPIPIPIISQTGHRGVIRSLRDLHTPDPDQSSSETNENRVKMESVSERKVIQCLRRFLVKEENHDTHIQSEALHTATASLDGRIVSPASLYSLARSTAIQAASLSLDSGSAHIPSPLSDCEDVKENSCLRGLDHDDGSANPQQADCQSDQSKDSRGDEDDAPQDVEHTYARSAPPKLREKNTHVAAQTQTWEKNTHTHSHTHTAAQGSEPSGWDDQEPAVKRRCLRIRDQNK